MTVHISPAEGARSVLTFWFDEVGPDRWFAKDDALDRAIAVRFSELRESVVATRAEGWRDDLATLGAAIILIDQFSRNIFRGTAAAFAADPLALVLCKVALDRGWISDAPPPWRQFMLMPLMHSEKLSDQRRALVLFAKLDDPRASEYARLHHDQIDRFGRFPGRNAALGRRSTPEELDALADGAAF
jgi:uncharacterized protein (DUF924 family)